jgi:heptosyltransferase-2
VALDARALEKALSDTRSLVVAPNWVGDTVMALPVLDALAASGRELHVLAKHHLGPLLGLSQAVTATIERGATDSESVERLRQAECAEAFILPNSFRSAWLPYLAVVPTRFGYRGNLRSLLLAPGVPAPSTRGAHQVTDYERLLTVAGVALPGEWRPHLSPSPEAIARADEVLQRAGLSGDSDPLVGLFPGAEFGPSKRWPWQRFGELTHALRRVRRDVRLLLLAGPKEVWSTVRIHEASGKLVPVLGADLDLAELAGLLSRLDLLITNDSGPMHMAAALGVPCVALFGPTNPSRTRPYGDEHEVLYTDRWCSPCFRKRCPLLHHKCMKDIGVEQVTTKALAILEGRSSRDSE